MDSFSVAALTSSTSSISQRALSGAGEIRSLQRAAAPNHDTQAPPLSDLVTLADLLEKASRDAEKLGQALGASAAVAERLQTKLKEALTASETTVAGLAKQLMRLDADSLGSVYVSYVRRQQRAVLAYSDLFQYYTQIVVLPDRDHQDRRLDTEDWQQLTEMATQAAREATQSPNTILTIRSAGGQDATSPVYTAPSSSSPRDSQADDGEPRGFGSFVSSLKAMMSSVLPKPDPLVCALCEACARGDVRLVQGLLEQGANIDGKNENRDTPMHVAIQANQVEVASLLMDSGADLEGAHSSAKLPPLFQAAAAGQTGMVKMFLDHGCDPLQTQPYSSTSYFYDVVETGSVEGARLLLEHGCDAECSNSSSRKAIVAAVRRDSVPMVELLIAHGAKVRDVSDTNGGSILSAAVATKNLAMVRALLDAGADADARTSSGSCVLAQAIADHELPVAYLLLSRGARGDRSTLSGQPLVIAAIRDKQLPAHDKTELVRRLLQRGAKATSKENGTPALRYALEQPAAAGGSGMSDIVAMLLQHGAEANKCTMNSKTGETALLYAIRTGRSIEAGHLLKHGANPNEGCDGKQSNKGIPLPSPLVQAVVKRDATLIRLLRSHGAKLDETMLEFAKVVVEEPQLYETITAPPANAAAGQGQQRRGRELSVQVDISMGRGSGTRAASPPPAYEAVSTPAGK